MVMPSSLLLILLEGGCGFLRKHAVVIAAVEQAEVETAEGNYCEVPWQERGFWKAVSEVEMGLLLGSSRIAAEWSSWQVY